MNNYVKKMKRLLAATIVCCAFMVIICAKTRFFAAYAVGSPGDLFGYESLAYAVIPLVACILWILGNYRAVQKGNIALVRNENVTDCRLVLVGWLVLAVVFLVRVFQGSSIQLMAGIILMFYLPMTIWCLGLKRILAAQE